MSESTLVKGFTNTANKIQIKFTVALLDTSNNWAFVNPVATTGKAPIAGVLYDSILPPSPAYYDFANGVYQYTLNGTSWPSGVLGFGNGVEVPLVVSGIAKVLFSGTGSVAPGDRLVLDYTVSTFYPGLVCSAEADGLSITPGPNAILGNALTAATTEGQVIWCNVNIR